MSLRDFIWATAKDIQDVVTKKEAPKKWTIVEEKKKEITMDNFRGRGGENQRNSASIDPKEDKKGGLNRIKAGGDGKTTKERESEEGQA